MAGEPDFLNLDLVAAIRDAYSVGDADYFRNNFEFVLNMPYGFSGHRTWWREVSETEAWNKLSMEISAAREAKLTLEVRPPDIKSPAWVQFGGGQHFLFSTHIISARLRQSEKADVYYYEWELEMVGGQLTRAGTYWEFENREQAEAWLFNEKEPE